MRQKHLSRIIFGRTGITITLSFLAMLAVTCVFVYLYGKSNTESFVRFCLEDIDNTVLSRMDYNMKNQTLTTAGYYDRLLAQSGTDDELIREITDEFKNRVEHSIHSEMDIVDPKGIIIISSTDGNVGFDMYSDPETARFLTLSGEEEDVVIQDIRLGAAGGEEMRCAAAPLQRYGGTLIYGFDPADYAEFKELSIDAQVDNATIGRDGYYLNLDSDATVISSPDPEHIGTKLIFKRDIKELADNEEIIRDRIFGVSSYIGVIRNGDHYIAAVYPSAEAWETWNALLSAMILIYAVVFVILFFVIRRLVAQQVVRGVYSINDTLLRITGGDLNERADFSDSVEFCELSDGINHTVDRLKELKKEAESRIDAELAFAAKIQSAFIPNEFPAFPDRDEFDLFAAMSPAKEVGGDFYDYFLIDEDHLALVIADVSGKGLSAAMFMAAAKDRIQNCVRKNGMDVTGAIGEANTELMKENDARLFVTVWLGVITLSNGHLVYVNAGHEYPAIGRSGESFTADKDEHCIPVAALKKAVFTAGSLDLNPGDTLFLYTDGITEANDPSRERFGKRRMLDALDRAKDLSAEETDAYVRSVIAEFTQDTPQFDDMTTLVFKYRGTKS